MRIDIDSSKDLSHFNEYYLVSFSKVIIKIFQIYLLKKMYCMLNLFFVNFMQNLLNLVKNVQIKNKTFLRNIESLTIFRNFLMV